MALPTPLLSRDSNSQTWGPSVSGHSCPDDGGDSCCPWRRASCDGSCILETHPSSSGWGGVGRAGGRGHLYVYSSKGAADPLSE